MPFLFRRFIETIGTQVLLSVVFSLLFFSGALPQKIGVITVAMVICLLMNFIFLFVCLKGYLLSVCDLKKYFLANLTVAAVLAALSMLFAAFNIEPLFTWLFFPFKLFFIRTATTKFVSAAVINILFLVFTAVVPLFVRAPDRK